MQANPSGFNKLFDGALTKHSGQNLNKTYSIVAPLVIAAPQP
jgi:hypothetical protein